MKDTVILSSTIFFEMFTTNYSRCDVAQLGERVPPSLSNDVIKLLGVRVPIEANFYDPTTFLLLLFFTSFFTELYKNNMSL